MKKIVTLIFWGIVFTMSLICPIKTNATELDSVALDTFDLKSYKPPTDFDWELLNDDGLDLSLFEKQNTMTPTKLVGGIFDTQERTYFLSFGSVIDKNTYNWDKGIFTSLGQKGTIETKIETKGTQPILSPHLIGVKKGEGVQDIFGYQYNPDTALGTRYASFDVGTINSKNQIDNALIKEKDTIDQGMSEYYTRENEYVAYGWAVRKGIDTNGGSKTVTYMPVRLHGYVVDFKQGRVRFDLTYYNNTGKDQTFINNYGIHVSVGGAHKESKLYSNSEDGLYFNQLSTPVDNVGARIYFYQSGYDNMLGPTDRKVGNLGSESQFINAWALPVKSLYPPLYGNPIDNKNPLEIWDPEVERNAEYDLSHPVFSMRWSPSHVLVNESGTSSLDVSILETKEKYQLLVDYLDEEGNEISSSKEIEVEANSIYDEEPVTVNGYSYKGLGINSASASGTVVEDTHIIFEYKKNVSAVTFHYQNESGEELAEDRVIEAEIGSEYNEEPIKIKDFAYIKSEGNTSGILTEEPQEATFVYTSSKDFKLLETVEKKDGSSADKVLLGDSLVYTVELKSLRTEINSETKYETLELPTKISDYLENVKNYKLIDGTDDIVGDVVYDEETRVLKGTLDESKAIDQRMSFRLVYEADVKNDVEIGSSIKEKALADVTYSNGFDPRIKMSNEVNSEVISGDLIFESAPSSISFGENITISSNNKEYPQNHFFGELSVRDLRGSGSKWHLTGKMEQELTNNTSILNEGMYYVNQGNEQLMDMDNSALIHEQETENASSIIISNEWSKETGLRIKIPAGKAETGNYTGEILWTLVDGPSNL